LPIFLEGLREKTEPYMFLAENGTIGMIVQGKDKIKDVLPDLIFPLKSNLFNFTHPETRLPFPVPATKG
jgi:hypothetical protein